MCLFARLIRNPKYKANKKNGGVIPPCFDERVKLIPVGCGECMECRVKKARDWNVRLQEDIKHNTNGKMVTLTFSNEWYKHLVEVVIKKTKKEIIVLERKKRRRYVVKDLQKDIDKLKNRMEGYDLDNAVATQGVRYFNERWRKKFKVAIRHWLVTELGHNGTENIHLHGILWTNEKYSEIRDIWKYGYIYPRDKYEESEMWVDEQTINYSVKYIHKIDKEHKYYKSKVLTSAGMGKGYCDSTNASFNKYKEEGTKESFTTRTGHKMGLPIYWRNKIYSEEEREKLWIEKLDSGHRWVNGVKVDVSKGEDIYYKVLRVQQQKNLELGYGNGEIDWKERDYELARRALMQKKRIED